MDGLDLLKKDWKKQEAKLPHLSHNQIYSLLLKKSSSIVRWIFIISIIEFLLGILLNIFLIDDKYWKQIEHFHLKTFTIASFVVSYAITFYFIYCFYKNYKRISATDSSVKLMKNILKTRKTVKHYIAYVLISTAITSLVYLASMVYNHSAENNVEDPAKYLYNSMDWFKFIGLVLIVLVVILGLIWLFYRLIYGILLRRLKQNYVELKKLELK